jgi:hypothetical protein
MYNNIREGKPSEQFIQISQIEPEEILVHVHLVSQYL